EARHRALILLRHPEVAAKRPSKDGRPSCYRLGQRSDRRPSRLASLAPQCDGSTFETAASSRECLRIPVHRRLELSGSRIVEIVRRADRVEDVGILVAQQAEQTLLEGAHA